MEEYIINPMVFYWIHVFSVLSGLAFAFTFVSVMSFLFCAINYFSAKEKLIHYEKGDYVYDRESKKCVYWQKLLKITSCMAIVFSALMVFTPNEETSYKMLIASSLTKNNIEVSRDFVIETIDKAVDRIVNNKSK